MNCRPLLLLAALLSVAAVEPPKKTELIPPAEGALQGRSLVAEILAQKPARNFTNSGTLTIRFNKKLTTLAVTFRTVAEPGQWRTEYEARQPIPDSLAARLTVIHQVGSTNRYQLSDPAGTPTEPAGNQTMTSFAGSDFWLADLGLEFLHWPDQRVLYREMRRSRSCRVLQSTNPHPAPEAYSRVVSWIDNESGGIVHAEAYDARGKVLKEFDPKDFKKVEGEWQLEEMEIANRQTGSRTRIEFNLETPADSPKRPD